MLGLIGSTPQIHHFHYDISWLNDIFSWFWYTPHGFFELHKKMAAQSTSLPVK